MENTRYSRTPANLSTERLRCALCWVVCVAAIALHGDTLTTSIDQRTGGGQWHAVGNLHFHAGNAGCVSIGNSGTDGYVIADAVRFAQGATEIVVDNSDGNHVETVGSWASSSSTTDFYGSDYLHDGNTGKGEKSITFRPALPSSGEYEVSIRWTSATNRASNVPVLVEYNIAPPAWQLTVSGAGGSGEYAAEVPVALSATAPRPNMRFDRWTCNPPGHFTDPFAPQTTLTMPDTHATVVAVWRDDTEAVLETARSLPVASVVDIVIIGANVGAVGAALRAAGDGADVLLVSPDYFVGSEMCAQNRYWLGPNETPESATAQALFGTRASSAGYHFVEPGDFKRTAERLLQEAGVKMLYKSYGVGVVLDHAGNPGGVVIANKAGRQVVVAKQMIDATPTGVVASTAGATREAWPAGLIQVSRTHYGSAISGTNCTAIGDYTECILSANMLTGSWRERCQAEMQLRTAYDLGDANWPAQAMHMLEPNRIVTEATHIGTWPGAEALDLACCRPADVPNVHMLSGMCGVSRDAAADLMRPVALLRLGDRIGAEAHARADALSTPSGLSVRATTVSGAKAYEVAELLDGHRPAHEYASVAQSESAIPVWGKYDVIVAGGGTSGAPAAIAAARRGARVLVIEMHGALGGTGVNGIGHFWYGYRSGFAVELTGSGWGASEKATALMGALADADGEVWFNTLACGVLKDGNRVVGVVVATPLGRACALGDVIVDATGDADVATCAGADVVYVNDGDLAIQEDSYLGAGTDGDNYANEFRSIFADPADIYGMTLYHVLNRRHGTHNTAFEYYPLAGLRETRLIKGDYTVTALDQYVGRTYHDLIAVYESDFDMHGYFNGQATYARLFPDGRSYVPYRSLLPAGLESMLVIGRCKSVAHDALPLSRMQSDLANEGYAAGYAAALSIQTGENLRSVDIGLVQEHLVEIGNISSAHRDTACVDMPPPTPEQLAAAAEAPELDENMAVLLTGGSSSIAPLTSSFTSAPSMAKARALCLLGSSVGAVLLGSALRTRVVAVHLYLPQPAARLT